MNEHIWVPFRLIYALCDGMRWRLFHGAFNEVEANRFCRRFRTLCRRAERFSSNFSSFYFFLFFFFGGNEDDRCAIDAISHVQYGGVCNVLRPIFQSKEFCGALNECEA